ncbi:C4-dicarboxylate ABC transporter permease [Paenibacillus sp. MY03]|jgi:C4-dicarboxylate transporter DctM subunit|uniref:C4-dicarboxylate ABC transporter permease n=1 Tax=Paenibacillus agaridevorans TaxID=171404 RepID=A0A2R5EKJ1_9BACL|nr:MULTISPECIES: TRAP transporter large permease [Paenibacillus]OUS77166.1 C4-dicarboxylate ABC transporter permease [Paenibacillus sp. MY03]GBG07057.1 C4-dicarboxylate ABC transporter permease [Paenibacillus agaridevorans]
MIYLILVMFLLFFIGVPIAYALGFTSILAILFTDPDLLINVPRRIFRGIDSFSLIAIPLFIMAGEIMSKGGISARLIRFAQTLVGHFPAGLAMVVVLASMFFSAVTGSAIATAAAIGGMLIPVMKKEGYDIGFSSSLVATSAILGPIIPPSIFMVLYGVMANASIADLFMAGVMPGVLIGLGLLGYCYYVGKKMNYKGRETRATGKEVATGLKDAFLALLMPTIMVGGILSGLFTATESGVIAIIYSLIIAIFVYKELKLKDVLDILLTTSKISAAIILLIGSASLFTWLLSYHRIPDQLIELLGPFAENPFMLLLLMNVILLIAGTFIDAISALMIFTPLFLPLALAAGIDPVHLGVVMAVNVSIGQITPPVGVCLFVTSSIAKIKVPQMLPFIWPKLIILLVIQVLITYVPEVSLFIPDFFNRLTAG